MYLVIDPSYAGEIVLYGYSAAGGWESERFSNKPDLPLAVSEWLLRHALDPKALEGVGVVLGKGRFTATRLATTVANAFKLACQTPVFGISAINFERPPNFSRDAVFSYITPVYSGEARIGTGFKT